MTKDLVALANRARSMTVIAVLVAGAMLLTGPTPARAIARNIWATAIPEALAARIAALRALLGGARRRQANAPMARAATSTVEPEAPPLTDASSVKDPAPDEPVGEAPQTEAMDEPVAEASQTKAPAPTDDGPRRSPSALQAGAPVIGYVTAPTPPAAGDLSPAELAIERACERHGWQLVAIVRDREDGRILERPGLSHALEQIADGQAEGLVVNDARLLSRSLDFGGLVTWFRDAEAALVGLDLGLDTSTPEGRRMASTLIMVNGWAGERIARRASVSAMPSRALLERIAAMYRDDMSLPAIAAQLNEEHVETPSGSHVWWPSTVQTCLRYWRAQARAPISETPLERHEMPLERRASG
jgi:hypothetical protein